MLLGLEPVHDEEVPNVLQTVELYSDICYGGVPLNSDVYIDSLIKETCKPAAVSRTGEFQYKSTNIAGIKDHYKLTWRKILNIVLLGAIIWILLRNYFVSPGIQETTKPKLEHVANNNICLYYPSSQHYTLRLQPKNIVFPLSDLETNDYKKLIDLTDFSFVLNEPNKCINSSILLLVLVISAPTNLNRRNTIRNTWGQQDSKIRVLFMLGAVVKDEIQSSIQIEHQTYGDIVQGNFIDSYRNLTYKTMMTLKYSIYHCPNAIYIFKTDDDVFINMPLMKNYLTNDLSPFGAQNLLQCRVFLNNKVLRGNSKWALTEEEFAPSQYPVYCNGAWALFSPDVLFKLYKEAQKTKFLFLEDVFLYGIAGSKVKGLVHSDIKNLTLSYKSVYGLAKGQFDNINFLIGTFGMNETQLKEYWDYVLNKPVRSSVYDYSEFDSV